MNTADEILSTSFELNPGIVLKGVKIKHCQIRLLTRGERKAIALEQDETTRDDLFFAQSIARFGTIEDRNEIGDLVDKLVRADELRIRGEMAKLDAKFLTTDTPPEEPAVKKTVRASDILSEPFSLNPGIVINGQRVTTCVVRLLTRGEWRQVQALENKAERDDLYYLLSVVQFGEVTNTTPGHIDELLDVDVQRINDEIGRLEELYAPESKSGDGEPEPAGAE